MDATMLRNGNGSTPAPDWLTPHATAHAALLRQVLRAPEGTTGSLGCVHVAATGPVQPWHLTAARALAGAYLCAVVPLPDGGLALHGVAAHREACAAALRALLERSVPGAALALARRCERTEADLLANVRAQVRALRSVGLDEDEAALVGRLDACRARAQAAAIRVACQACAPTRWRTRRSSTLAA